MNGILRAAVLVALAASDAHGVRSYGTLRAIYHDGQTGSAVQLADVLPNPSFYAVGALAELAGEVTVVAGKAYLSYPAGDAESRTEATSTPTAGAALLVAASVAEWRSIVTTKPIPFDELDRAIEALAAEAGIPSTERFPFLVEGQVERLEWHVIDGTRLAADATGHQAHLDASVRATAAKVRATLVGFFSPRDQGVFTHMGSKTHLHCVIDAPLASGHVDHVVIPAGATIQLPVFSR